MKTESPGSMAIVDYKTSADADFAAYEFQLAIYPLGRTDPEGVKSSLWKWYKARRPFKCPRPIKLEGAEEPRAPQHTPAACLDPLSFVGTDLLIVGHDTSAVQPAQNTLGRFLYL